MHFKYWVKNTTHFFRVHSPFDIYLKTFLKKTDFREIPQTRNFCLMKEVFHKQRFLHRQKKFFADKDQKVSLKAKIIDPFNTKFGAKK